MHISTVHQGIKLLVVKFLQVDSKTTSKSIVLRDNVGGKKKKKSHSAVSGHISSNRKLDTFANNDVCLAALQSKLFSLCGCNHHHYIYLYIVRLCLIQRHRQSARSCCPVNPWPYHNKLPVKLKWANSTYGNCFFFPFQW